MSLKHCIIHKIERTQPAGQVSCEIRDIDNPATGSVVSVFEQAKQCYQRSGQKQFGHFDKTKGDNPLSQWLKDQQQGKSDFNSLSKRIAEHLKTSLENTDEPFSMHLMLAIDVVMEQEFFYIFWLEHSEANQITGDMDVLPTAYLNTSRIPFAVKVYLHEWLEEDSLKYLSLLVSRGNKNLSDAFTDFSAFSQGVDLAEQTNEFLDVVDQFADTLPEDKMNEYKAKVINYCVEQDKTGEPVCLQDLSHQVNENAPREFSSFVQEQNPEQHEEFHTDRGSLKRYIRFSGRDNAMSISFSADKFGQDVTFNPQTGELTIKQVPKSLKQQLSKYLQKYQN